ncbi:hypothetical protein CEUSTIGMA_g12248.t1 [Chlamydomonas eustigma]|uniref:PPM-type phosphatase domain-containing protein n=1 Tax=Chlamydomonas eustigma TaxID=1157962 RepID=A0A250XP27_9CHLO|nr:hypothetical protein CEUSTIGMA_g12248.t1 [Chlamydomonas eustigma]|eukprot:GAX84827.1 hypothetical protein CEUSTIGMA_g12248.t1 [Chlamydomonas eustigma]
MGVVKCLLLLRSILVRYSTRTFASLQTSFLSKFLLHSLTKFSRLRKVYENWFPTTDGVSPVLGLNESASVPHDLGAGSHFFTELAGSFYDTEEDDEHSSSSCLSEIHSLPDFLPVDDNRNCIALLAPLTSQTTAHAQQTPHLRIQDWLSQHLIDTPYFMHGRPSFPSKRSLKFRNTTSICSRAALSSLSASQEPASRLFSVEDLKPDHVDAVDTFSQAVCCGLFDGHGGAEVAEHLAEFLPQTLSLRSHAIKSQGVQEMAAILQSTESALYERYQREWLPLDRDPGSTALLTMVMDEELLVANSHL